MFKNALSAMLVAATIFIQFKNPATGELLFVTNEETGERLKDEAGNDMPIGVTAHGPGSKLYRRVHERLQSANIKRGKKGLTGAVLREDATTLMAETITEFVNFNYNGAGASPANTAKMLDDDEYAAVREQIEQEQGDLGNFVKRT